jgi:hypothetical protein
MHNTVTTYASCVCLYVVQTCHSVEAKATSRAVWDAVPAGWPITRPRPCRPRIVSVLIRVDNAKGSEGLPSTTHPLSNH